MSPPPHDAPVHYFAFGANMASKVLVRRRGIEPLASRAAMVEGYGLRFALRGLPLFEPAFASLVEAPGEVTHGVLHTLRRADLLRLDRIEGSYDRVDVSAHTHEGVVEATAYMARRISPERTPSRRYLGLLVEGAREHGLPDAWVEQLLARRSAHVRLISPAIEAVVDAAERALSRLRRPQR